jgi:signal transduction histidine kinase
MSPVPLLEGLSPAEIDRLLEIAESRVYPQGEIIISEHAPGDTLFLITSGQVRVEKQTLQGRQETLTRLGAGECFGELSLVDRRPRSATVRAAAGGAEVRAWSRASLTRFLVQNPDVYRRLLENLVKIAAHRLRRLDETLVESAYDAVVEVDDALRVLRWERFGPGDDLLESAAGGEAIGRDLLDAAPALGEPVRVRLREVMATGEVALFPLEREAPDGGPRHLELTVAPSPGGRGAVLGLRDVTESKLLESRLIQAEKLAMAGRMSAEIGHELRNFLAGALGLSELLLGDRDLMVLPRPAERVRSLATQIEKMQRFALGLLDLGMVRSRRQHSDLNLLIQRLVAFVQGQSRFRVIELCEELDPALPPLSVDPGQMQQVLLNLYTNAAEAIGGRRAGRIVTTTRLAGGRARIDVADDGPGMPEEVRRRVFEHGFTTRASGHGFGLAICRRIVENHGGSIDVESEPGRGTRFVLTLPLEPDTVASP